MTLTNAPLVGRKKLIKVGDEATAGTLAGTMTLLGANCYNVKCEPGELFSEGDRMPDGNYLGRVAGVQGLLKGKLSFDFDLAPLGPFMGTVTLGGQIGTGAGFVLNGGTLTPSSDLSTRICKSFQVYEDGRVKQLTGCQGNITINAEVGKKVVAHCEFEGIWGGVTDSSMPSQTPIVAAPYVAKGATLTIAASAIGLTSKLSIDLGTVHEDREAMTASAGIGHHLVTDILPKLTLDPEAALVATSDVYGAFLGGATAAFSLILVANSHTLTITGPAIQRVKVGDEERGKKLVDSLEANFCNSSGDDAIKFVEA